jgi:hypothetical protein
MNKFAVIWWLIWFFYNAIKLTIAAPKGKHPPAGAHEELGHIENEAAGKPIDASVSYPLQLGPGKCDVM